MQQPGLINSLLSPAQMASLPDQTQIGDYESAATNDEFLDQILSSLPSWTDFGSGKPAWELKQDGNEDQNEAFNFDHSALLVSKLRQPQINGMVQQSQLIGRSEVGDCSPFKSPNSGLESSVQALYNGFASGMGQNPNQSQLQQFLQSQNYGPPAAAMNQTPATSSAGGVPAQPRQRVRARRGQATDPHSIAERLRRERIAERMKALQELVPNANKTDKASMLDEIVDYVKFLQLQVKVLSMSRLGGAAAVPLVADMSSAQATGTITASSDDDDKAMAMTEHQVAKLMEEDMGTAMQYLQNKGLCLMPISLASTISSATCRPRNNSLIPATYQFGNGGPTSPSASVLTVQSSAFGNGVGVNDATSGSKA